MDTINEQPKETRSNKPSIRRSKPFISKPIDLTGVANLISEIIFRIGLNKYWANIATFSFKVNEVSKTLFQVKNKDDLRKRFQENKGADEDIYTAIGRNVGEGASEAMLDLIWNVLQKSPIYTLENRSQIRSYLDKAEIFKFLYQMKIYVTQFVKPDQNQDRLLKEIGILLEEISGDKNFNLYSLENDIIKTKGFDKELDDAIIAVVNEKNIYKKSRGKDGSNKQRFFAGIKASSPNIQSPEEIQSPKKVDTQKRNSTGQGVSYSFGKPTKAPEIEGRENRTITFGDAEVYLLSPVTKENPKEEKKVARKCTY